MNVYSKLLIGSTVCLAVGGYLLYGVVPFILTVLTYLVVLVLLALAYLVETGNWVAKIIGALMAVLAIASSSTSPAHLSALARFGSNYTISLLDVLMVLGFYVFPGTYLVFFVSEKVRGSRAGKV